GSDASELLREAQHALRSGVLWELLRSGERDPRRLAEGVYGGGRIEFLEECALRFQCRCSEERIAGMLGMFTTIELDDMIANEGVVRREGAVPATVAVLAGRLTVGLDGDALERMARGGFVKAGQADLAVAVAHGRDAATTVSATAFAAARAGITVFATGGIG